MVSDYLEVVIHFVLSFTNINFFHDSIFHESEIRTVLLEVSIDLGLLKKSLLKTSKIVLVYGNSLARYFSSMVHAKCLLPRLDRLLLVRSCLQNFYQCTRPVNLHPLFLFWKHGLVWDPEKMVQKWVAKSRVQKIGSLLLKMRKGRQPSSLFE